MLAIECLYDHDRVSIHPRYQHAIEQFPDSMRTYSIQDQLKIPEFKVWNERYIFSFLYNCLISTTNIRKCRVSFYINFNFPFSSHQEGYIKKLSIPNYSWNQNTLCSFIIQLQGSPKQFIWNSYPFRYPRQKDFILK